jgi:TetR/AcrR family fatty acid metabolism transcriptional regulator
MATAGTRTAPVPRGRPARAGLRAEILRTAEAEFMGRDFHAVVMDDIAKRCGVGKGTLYRYFANKQELLQAVMRDGLITLKQQIHGTIESASPPAEKLAGIVGAILAHFLARPGLARIVDREEGKRGVSQTRWFRSRAEVARLLAKVIADGIRDGAFKPVDPRLAAEMLLGMIRAMNRYGAAQTPIAVVTRTVMSVFLTGITRPDTVPAARTESRRAPAAQRRVAAGTRRRGA